MSSAEITQENASGLQHQIESPNSTVRRWQSSCQRRSSHAVARTHGRAYLVPRQDGHDLARVEVTRAWLRVSLHGERHRHKQAMQEVLFVAEANSEQNSN